MNTQFTMSGSSFATNITRFSERPKLMEQTQEIEPGGYRAFQIEPAPGRCIAIQTSAQCSVLAVDTVGDTPSSGVPCSPGVHIFPLRTEHNDISIFANDDTGATVNVVIF